MHCLRLTTATTRCALAKWNTNQCGKTPTACQTNLDPAGRALAVRDLVAKKNLPARAPVTFQRGTSICIKELRFLCKTAKNRSVISHKFTETCVRWEIVLMSKQILSLFGFTKRVLFIFSRTEHVKRSITDIKRTCKGCKSVPHVQKVRVNNCTTFDAFLV